MPKYTEQDLIDGCKANIRTYQEQLYKQYHSLFLKVCARYANDMYDAEQLLQDGFLKIFHNIKRFEGKGSFEGWMRRIMVNCCLDYLKSKYTKETKKVFFPEELSENKKYATHNEALSKMEFDEVLKLIQGLSPMSKTVFNLYVFEGYSHKEIGAMMKISEGTSQWHVNNARKNLQQKINLIRQKDINSI